MSAAYRTRQAARRVRVRDRRRGFFRPERRRTHPRPGAARFSFSDGAPNAHLAHDRAPAGSLLRRAARIARLAERTRLRDPLPLRPLHELPGRRPEGPPPTRGRSWRGWRARPSTIRLGVLVSPVTFRHPGAFAKVVTTVDEMSGGRRGRRGRAGWNEVEHRALGLEFRPIQERADLMEDELALLTGSLGASPTAGPTRGTRSDVEAELFRPTAGAAAPPADHHRRDRQPAVAAPGRSIRGRIQHVERRRGRVPRSLRRAWTRSASGSGATPASIRRSVMAGVLMAATPAEMEHRARRRWRWSRPTGPTPRPGSTPGGRAGSWAAPRRPGRRSARFAAAGAERLMLQDLLPRDLDMIELAAAELIGWV